MSNERKGIILAGGTGSRLYPLTVGISKQLLPVYDKPMIYYPLTVLMLSEITEILIITTPEDQDQFKRVLGNGKQWGLNLYYKAQESPDGLAQAYVLSEEFLDGSSSAMVLGDNIFFGHGLPQLLRKASLNQLGGTIFGYHVSDPQNYGVIEFDGSNKIKSIKEKPKYPASNYAVTGLYFLDNTASLRAKDVKPSQRGELEITHLLESYLNDEILQIEKLGRGFSWLDTGTHASLLDAGNFVKTLTERQGLQVGSPDEVAYNLGLIDRTKLMQRADLFGKNSYGYYLSKL